MLATVMERPHPIANPSRADVVIFELTVENRCHLSGQITAMIRKESRQNR